MKWVVFFIAILVIIYLIRIISGKEISPNKALKFWKIAQKNPFRAYQYFLENDCFYIFEKKPASGYKANLPPGDWDGPFTFRNPETGHVISIFGRNPDYQHAQGRFIEKFGQE